MYVYNVYARLDESPFIMKMILDVWTLYNLERLASEPASFQLPPVIKKGDNLGLHTHERVHSHTEKRERESENLKKGTIFRNIACQHYRNSSLHNYEKVACQPWTKTNTL